MPYESGMDPIHDTRRRFAVRFHLVAIAFLVFDVELLFLYPWAVAMRHTQSVDSQTGAVAADRGIDLAVAENGFPIAVWYSPARWYLFCLSCWVSLTTGGRGSFDGDRTARKRGRQQAR